MNTSPKFVSLLLVAGLSLSAASAQSVTTDPVGFNKTTCLGNSDTVVTIPLTRAPDFTGTVASVASNVITISGTPGWTNNQFVYSAGTQPKTYYVLIGALPIALNGTVSTSVGSKVVSGSGTNFLSSVSVGDGLLVNSNYYVATAVTSDTSLTVNLAVSKTASGLAAAVSKGPKEGSFYTVTANGTNTLTLDLGGDSIASVGANTQIKLMPYWTLGTAFPASDVNVSYVASTVAFAHKTEILLPDNSGVGAGQGINLSSSAIYYYFNGAWRKVGQQTTVDASDDILLPDTYFTVRNNDATTTAFSPSGSVSLGKFSTVLLTSSTSKQDNAIGLLRPSDVALNDLGLITSGAFTPTALAFNHTDELFVFDNNVSGINKSASAIYFYFNSAWRKVGSPTTDDAGIEVIPASAGLVIRKNVGNGSPVAWQNSPNYQPN